MTHNVASARPEEDRPDPRALELAAMSDLVASGAANNVYVTLARPIDPDESADLATLADRITAARGCSPTSSWRQTPSPCASRAATRTRRRRMDDLLILLVLLIAAVVTYGLVVLSERLS